MRKEGIKQNNIPPTQNDSVNSKSKKLKPVPCAQRLPKNHQLANIVTPDEINSVDQCDYHYKMSMFRTFKEINKRIFSLKKKNYETKLKHRKVHLKKNIN